MPPGHPRVTNLFMPAAHGQLRGQDHGSGLMAVFADLPEAAAFRFAQPRHGPVVDDVYIDAAQFGKQEAEASIGAGDGQITEQSG